MPYIKIIGIITVFLCSVLMGQCVSRSYKNHLHDMQVLNKIMIMLNGEIRYTMTPLPEAFLSIGEKESTVFGVWLLRLAKALETLDGRNFQSVWQEELVFLEKNSNLKKEDIRLLATLGTSLGYLDKEMQMNAIALFKEQLEGRIKEGEISLKDKQKLVSTLGVLGGIFFIIVLI